jgi:alpha-L-arabinofuranosidase
VLSHPQLNAHNTFAQPETVKPRTVDLEAVGPDLRLTLAPASVNRLDVELA